jgi:acetyl-CoA acetyltransferase
MARHPFSDVVIASVHNTVQARRLKGHDSYSITLEAARGVLAEAGLDRSAVDGVYSRHSAELIYDLGIGPAWETRTRGAVGSVLEAASVIATGLCTVVLIAEGGAGVYTEREATAPWTRPANEYVLPFGLYTAVEFALIARRHMAMFGTRPEHLAEVAATIRNNGHVNPEAVYVGRGPFTTKDILDSRMVADPFHLLDCAMTAEGGTALLLTTADRAQDLRRPPVFIHGGAVDRMGPAYVHPPTWELTGRSKDLPNGYIGKRAAQRAFAMAGLGPANVDCCEFYDPFSFEIIRQFEAFGFCGPGEGPDFIADGTIGPAGRFPVTTDGGTMSFSHGGGSVQILQRVVRGVQQLQRTCASCQVENAEVAMCSGGGAGALFSDVILLGRERP